MTYSANHRRQGSCSAPRLIIPRYESGGGLSPEHPPPLPLQALPARSTALARPHSGSTGPPKPILCSVAVAHPVESSTWNRTASEQHRRAPHDGSSPVSGLGYALYNPRATNKAVTSGSERRRTRAISAAWISEAGVRSDIRRRTPISLRQAVYWEPSQNYSQITLPI